MLFFLFLSPTNYSPIYRIHQHRPQLFPLKHLSLCKDPQATLAISLEHMLLSTHNYINYIPSISYTKNKINLYYTSEFKSHFLKTDFIKLN